MLFFWVLAILPLTIIFLGVDYSATIIFLGVRYSATIIFLGVGKLARLTSGIELPGFLINYQNICVFSS